MGGGLISDSDADNTIIRPRALPTKSLLSFAGLVRQNGKVNRLHSIHVEYTLAVHTKNIPDHQLCGTQLTSMIYFSCESVAAFLESLKN